MRTGIDPELIREEWESSDCETLASMSERHRCFFQDIEAALIEAGITTKQINKRETFASKEKIRKALKLDKIGKGNRCSQCLVILAEYPEDMPEKWAWENNGRYGDICNGCYSEMTKKEKQRMKALTDIGCIVCKRETMMYKEPEIHHLRYGRGIGHKKDHFMTIPLCPEHHRIGGYGTALHMGQAEWERRHGTELELLHAVDIILLTVKDVVL